ncbi:hypothetical protein PMAYCL1PPCAC_09294, partial [Pristionchus mayeri]
FMPIFSHSVGVLTILLTVLAMYLMMAKTPDHGKHLARYLMLLQISILMADLGWGFLFSPIFLFPLTALLCTGFICGTEAGRHIGTV